MSKCISDECKDKTGRITSYGFSCGYVQKDHVGPWEAKLWKEHGAFLMTASRTHDGMFTVLHDACDNGGPVKDARKKFAAFKRSLVK